MRRGREGEGEREREREERGQQYTLAKSPAISVVDPHGKVSVAATYSE